MRNITILTVFLFVTGTSLLWSQAEYVPANHNVYNFLEKMETLGLITSYNSFELPKTRREISQYINEIIKRKSELRTDDSEYLNDLITEFEYELFGTLKESSKIIGGTGYNIFSDKEKYLYFSADLSKGNLFVNLLAEGEGIYYRQDEDKKYRSFLGIIGGQIRGTLLDKFGFYLYGTNGKSFGDKNAALRRTDLRFNYKFNEASDQSFFDNTLGYITADFGVLKFKFGRDNINLGYGSSINILDYTMVPLDHIGMNIKYSFLNFSYFHGKLQGVTSYLSDSITNGSFVVGEKYLGYHRLALELSRYFNFSVGEFIIYGDRSIDLAYLNPFNFYKSAEHSGKDRDNSMLFVDVNSIPLSGTKVFSSILIDDIKFSEIGTGWYGNQVLFSTGLYTNVLYKYVPLEMRFEYQRVEPYVFTHRLIRNNFTNSGYTLNRNSEPNSELLYTEIRYLINNRSYTLVDFTYRIHGANPSNPDGSVKNVGGDINLGHRNFDEKTVQFLDGNLEYARVFGVSYFYEYYNNILFSLRLQYLNNSLQTGKSENLDTFFTLSVKL